MKAIKTMLGAAILCLWVSATGWADITWVGSVTAIHPKNVGGRQWVEFDLSTGGRCAVVPYAPDVARVQFHWDGLWAKPEPSIAKALASWPVVAVQMADMGNVYRIDTPQLRIEVVKGPHFHVNFKDRQNGYMLSEGHRLEYNTDYHPINDPTYGTISFNQQQPTGFKVKAIRMAPAGEAYFGLGMHAQGLNKRGQTIQQWNTPIYNWQEHHNPLYVTFPFFYGVRGAQGGVPAFAYGILFNNPARSVFRMASEWNDKYSFEAGDSQIDYFFFGGGTAHTMRAVLDRYTELTGRPTLLPKWAYGYHQSRWSYDNQEWVEWLANNFTAEDIPLDAIHVDIDYMDMGANATDDNYTDNMLRQLQFNNRFPNPAGMIAHCEDRGVRLVPIVEPWLVQGDPLFAEAAGALHLVKNNMGWQYTFGGFFGTRSLIDFTSTPAANWWKGKLVNFLNQYPFHGIWNDLNEPAAGTEVYLDSLYWLDGLFGNDNANSVRWQQCVQNTYCVYQTKTTYAGLKQKFPNRRPFVLSRAGYPGIQRYALGWSGDGCASWDSCRFSIRTGLGVMISGQANYGTDVGGFVGESPDELITRWHEWAVLTPFCRNHSQKSNAEREIFRYPEPYRSLMRDTVKFRYRLMPYLYSLAYESTQSGVPMNTPAVFEFFGDTATYTQNEYDFMVGEHLLATPVYQQGAANRNVRLPSGQKWYYWHNEQGFNGGANVNVPAPLGTIPLFARAGAIVPMGPSMQYTDQFKPSSLDVHVWPSLNGSGFRLYEDDGISFDYEADGFAKTVFSLAGEDAVWAFSGSPRLGFFDPQRSSYRVIAHDVGQPDKVFKFAGGEATVQLVQYASEAILAGHAQGYTYDPATRKLVAKVSNNGGAFSVLSATDECIAEVAEAFSYAISHMRFGDASREKKAYPSDREVDKEREMADADAADMRDAMTALRKVRKTASGTSNGARYVKQYYAYSPELIRILTSKEYGSDLMPVAAELIAIVGLAAQDSFENGAKANPNPFTKEDWALGRETIKKLYYATKDKGLRQFLLDLNAMSYKAEGKSFADIFKMFL